MRGCNTRARTSLVRDAQPRCMHDDHVQSCAVAGQHRREGRNGRNDSESIYSTRRGEHALPHVRAHAGGGASIVGCIFYRKESAKKRCLFLALAFSPL
jgi:hypothetical protein